MNKTSPSSEGLNNGLSLIVPAYNESEAVSDTLRSLTQQLGNLRRPFEIIVVDDGSQDDTADKARAAGARVLQHPINVGYGRALLTGIESAVHETIMIIDADGTYPVQHLPELVALYDKGFDMVVGARQGKSYQPSWRKRLLRWIFRCLAEFTTGRSIPDINSGFRIFRRKPVLVYRESISTGFSFTTTVTLLFMLNGFFVGYVPIAYGKRIGPSKVRLFRDGLRSLQIIVTTIAQYNPLKLLLALSGITLLGVAAFALAAWRLPESPLLFWLIVELGWCTLALMAAISVLALAKRRPHNNPPSVS